MKSWKAKAIQTNKRTTLKFDLAAFPLIACKSIKAGVRERERDHQIRLEKKTNIENERRTEMRFER